MTAQIFDLARYQSKKALKPETLEQQAVSILGPMVSCVGEHVNISLTDYADMIRETNVALADHLDTAPCEYVAPEADPA